VDYTQFAPVAFCFLDIDLYNPIASVLPRIHDVLAPGGVIIVDDRNPAQSLYDGAGQACREFCATRGIAPEIAHDISASSENAGRHSGAAEVPPSAWPSSLISIRASPTR
jgi:hypothetical protein